MTSLRILCAVRTPWKDYYSIDDWLRTQMVDLGNGILEPIRTLKHHKAYTNISFIASENEEQSFKYNDIRIK